MHTHPISGSSSRFSSALAPDAIGAHVQRPHRILIVEDDVFVGVQYEDLLTQAGYQIIDIVPSAEEAIEAALDHNPELVIMDVRLAGKRDGVEAALEIFKRFGIRSIFASAYSDPEIHARAQAARTRAGTHPHRRRLAHRVAPRVRDGNSRPQARCECDNRRQRRRKQESRGTDDDAIAPL